MNLQDLRDRSEEVGACWLWKQGTSKAGYPIMKVRGCGCQLVRRIAAGLAGHELKPRQPVITTCDEQLCVNPKHCQPSTPTAVGLRAAEQGAFSQPARGAKIAAARRSSESAKLTLEQVQAIRASTESERALAAEYGVNRSVIGGIRRGDRWKDYTSPFAGLISSLAANDHGRKRA